MLILDYVQMLTERPLGQPQSLHPTLHPVTIGLEDAFRQTDGHEMQPRAPSSPVPAHSCHLCCGQPGFEAAQSSAFPLRSWSTHCSPHIPSFLTKFQSAQRSLMELQLTCSRATDRNEMLQKPSTLEMLTMRLWLKHKADCGRNRVLLEFKMPANLMRKYTCDLCLCLEVFPSVKAGL